LSPVTPAPAASVLLVRGGSSIPIELYVIRRHAGMRFLGGYYAFPGGRVDAADAAPEALARCRGLSREDAEGLVPSRDGVPALAFWVAAIREVLEETGVLLGSDGAGRPLDGADPAVARRIAALREALVDGRAPLAPLLAAEGWGLDLGPLRYLSHFITPPSSPIRFTARFFLAPVPPGQTPRLLGAEASEGFWIDPREGVRRFERGEMPMAEPAESAMAYLAEFPSLEALWAAHADGRHKIHGILDRLVEAGARDLLPPLPFQPGAAPDRDRPAEGSAPADSGGSPDRSTGRSPDRDA
jgi:8-oxo-dGTP pyrophosphatase MutT (NUDIX family)